MAHTPESRARAYEKVRARRKKWFIENGPCQECGATDDLHLDHADPSTKVSHRIWSWSEARRIEELAKCQVLCRPCHEKKTAKENSERMGGLKHGTEAMYRLGKCRCRPCLDAKNESKRLWRDKRRQQGLKYS